MDSAKPSRPDWSNAGPDDVRLSVRGVPRGRLAEHLAEQLRAAVRGATYAAGDRLPPTRLLAEQLGVSRGVVSEAYARLADEGLVEGRGRGGTVVRHRPGPWAGPEPARTATAVTAPGEALAAPGDNSGFQHLRSVPGRIDLTPGRPDLGAFPRGPWLRAEREVLRTASAEELGYGDPQGSPRLRRAVASWLVRTRGMPAAPDDLVVVAGVAQGLALLAQALLRRGTTAVAVEDPQSAGARNQLESWGLTTVPVPVDGEGLDVAGLAATRCRVVVTTPAHQFPTGVVLSGQRRRDLLEWAELHDGLVVEDDYDAEHRYDRAPVPALAATAPSRVAYLGSVSKLLAPALRIGWVVPPPWLRDEIVDLKRETDLGNPTLAQLVLADLLAGGDLERHLRAVRRRHRERRDALVAGLRTHGGLEVLGVSAGLHLTVRLPDGADELEVARDLLVHHGIKTQPLSWHRHPARRHLGRPGLVLGYADTAPGLLREAGEVIGRLSVGGGTCQRGKTATATP